MDFCLQTIKLQLWIDLHPTNFGTGNNKTENYPFLYHEKNINFFCNHFIVRL